MAKKKEGIKKIRKVKKEDLIHKTKIKVIGIGGGGSSIVSEIASNFQHSFRSNKKIDFVAANTDFQALKGVSKKCKIFHFGQNFTHGLGCGMDPNLGKLAAQNEKERITKILNGIDFCLLIASLGGGTGSGAAPIFAEVSKKLKTITLGIFTLPFKFEGSKKMQIAKNSLKKLIPHLNALIVIPNEKIFQLIDKKTPITTAFSVINQILSKNLQGLLEMIYLPGLINIDFADFKTILEGRGKLAYLNCVEARGQNRSEEVIKKISHNLLNEYILKKPTPPKLENNEGMVVERILFNVTGSKNLKMREVAEISQRISEYNRKSKIIFGISQNPAYNDKIRVTFLAIGKKRPKTKKIKIQAKKPQPTSKRNKKIKPIEKKSKISVKKKKVPKKLPTSQKPKRPKKSSQSQIKIPIEEALNAFSTATSPQVQNSHSSSPPRRNALELKKEKEQAEREILAQEKKWETPAFLRKKNKK